MYIFKVNHRKDYEGLFALIEGLEKTLRSFNIFGSNNHIKSPSLIPGHLSPSDGTF